MAKPKNEAIGDCPCPARGCDLTAQVFKFKGRADVSKQWLAGKMYLSCAQHGRFGSDGLQAMQEYILENSQIWDEKEKSARAAHVAAPARIPLPKPAIPAPETAPPPAKVPAKSRDLWDPEFR